MAANGRGLFVGGTDTGVGKTVVAASLLAAARAAGVAVAPLKPVLTGTEEEGEADDTLLARAAGVGVEGVSLYRYPYPASPHLASALAGNPLQGEELLASVRRALKERLQEGTAVVVEGVGGLLVPLADRFTVADLVGALQLPLLVVARPTLGTLNHTLLTLEAARRRALPLAGVVLCGLAAQPDPIERSNLETLRALCDLPVWPLALLPALSTAHLAAAGRSLPWRELLCGSP